MDEHTLNDLLECSVCLERLDTSSKVLPCQHTFCRKCLEIIVSSRQELRCPECRILVGIKIDDLPPNVLLMRILEGMKNVIAKSQQTQNAATESQQQTQQQQNNKNVLLNKAQHLYNLTTQQQRTQQQLNTQQQQQQTTGNAVAAAGGSAMPQQYSALLPHALAIFDFASSEPADLSFKKGDKILLKRRIDSNWYRGQLTSGVEGDFPINYVQIIVPLEKPLCFALYDFKMGPNEEEGCLSFEKGAVIQVLRRIDLKWAEGRIGNTIGIFPIAFVTLNAMAKNLLMNSMPSSTTETADDADTQTIPQQQQHNVTQTAVTTHVNRRATQMPETIANININNDSSTSSSNATSPSSAATTCSSSSSFSANNSLPNILNQSMPNTPQHASSVRYRDAKDKRRSLNALFAAGTFTTTFNAAQTNRHSAEILSVPNDMRSTQTTNVSQIPTQHMHTQLSNRSSSSSAIAATSSAVAGEQQQQSRISLLQLTAKQFVPPTLPWSYLALFPYKPRKQDELELKKGCVYIVTEYCADGWFKGQNWQKTFGVFPGNYVTPLRIRDQQQLMHQSIAPMQYTAPAAASIQSSSNKNVDAQNAHQNQLPLHQPPELPQRQSTGCSVWTKPLGQTVEAFFNKSSANKTCNESKDQQQPKERKEQNSASIALSKATASNLMKRLSQMKARSKSPAAVATAVVQTNLNISSKDNTSSATTLVGNYQSATTTAANLQTHPVHVRSGSCPSQLQQNNSVEHSHQLQQNHQPQQIYQHQQSQQQSQQGRAVIPTSAQAMYGSQRVRGSKERAQLQCIRQTADGTFRSNVFNNNNLMAQQLPQAQAQSQLQHSQAQQQQKSIIRNNLMQARQQICNNSNNANIVANHRKSQSLDANAVVSAAAVATLNATAAAIAASATTKSFSSAQESRFRCVVPYPPNSDVELELHVGDIIYVQRKQKNGWYKGTHARSNKTGLFPASFVEPDV